MINFQPFTPSDKEKLDAFLIPNGHRGCEYNFANLYLWGRQRWALVEGNLTFFSQFNRQSVYLFPIGTSPLKPTLDKVMEDAKKRGIPCRFTSLSKQDCDYLESLYPGKFHFHIDRNVFDYLYDIDDLADLKGRKFQKKRNHCNRFFQQYPNHQIVPITQENLPLVKSLLETWYEEYCAQNPTSDFYMEQIALKKALEHREKLQMEGVVLLHGGKPLAMTMGSRLSKDTFDIHFEKALETADGAYNVINQGFARWLRLAYPEIRYLNREDDLGLEGLRKAKLSYHPTKLIEKFWAALMEDGYEY